MPMIALFSKLLFSSFFAIISIWSNPLNAATVRYQIDEEMGCSILVDGVIEIGDAEALRALIEEQLAQDQANNLFWEMRTSPSGRRICFNSPGGSMIEAMEMAGIISGSRSAGGLGSPLGTAVGRNARCESACALAFMAGSWGHPEGEGVGPNRIIHPTARLGFHRPALIVEAGDYSEEAVDAAFSVALDTLGLIINARSASWLNFPESLFNTMLNTSHNDMYFVQTVGEASRLSIGVAPSPFFSGDAVEAILNICRSVDGALLDVEPTVTFGMTMQGLDLSFDAGRGTWVIDGGFREEAVSGCSVGINSHNEHNTDFIGYAFIGDYSPDRRMDILPFQSFPSETSISSLIAALPFSAIDFTDRAENSVVTDNQDICWITQPIARIVNVSQFTNLRAGAGISQPIVGRVPLGATVMQVNQGGYYATQRCLQICNGGDQRQIAQCIEGNEVWIEVQYNGQYGFLSRQFLAPQ